MLSVERKARDEALHHEPVERSNVAGIQSIVVCKWCIISALPPQTSTLLVYFFRLGCAWWMRQGMSWKLRAQRLSWMIKCQTNKDKLKSLIRSVRSSERLAIISTALPPVGIRRPPKSERRRNKNETAARTMQISRHNLHTSVIVKRSQFVANRQLYYTVKTGHSLWTFCRELRSARNVHVRPSVSSSCGLGIVKSKVDTSIPICVILLGGLLVRYKLLEPLFNRLYSDYFSVCCSSGS